MKRFKVKGAGALRAMTAMVLLASLGAAGCAKSGGEGAQAAVGTHKAVPGAVAAPGKEMIPVIQGQKLASYPDRTIGEVFGRYRHFDRKEWKEAKVPGGKFYVDYVGWYPGEHPEAGTGGGPGAVKGVEVKFVIYPDGAFDVAMVSKIASGADGTLAAYPLADAKAIIDAIYADEKIRF